MVERKETFWLATPAYIQLLMAVIEKEPSELGYEFGRWSANRLATYLEQQIGIKLSGEQVRRILKKKKYVYLWGAGLPDRVLCPATTLQNIAWRINKTPRSGRRLKKSCRDTLQRQKLLQKDFKFGLGMKAALVLESLGGKIGAKKVLERKSQDNAVVGE